MITFKKISYRNFLSSGNNTTEINFTDTQTTLIVGANGSGKSTMLDALCFGLFNKAFRKITKGQLVNSTNGKDCLVEIDFTIGSKEYKVKRGIKPNIFEIWIDGVLQNQSAAVVDQQKQLEESILKLNYKSFTQIVILGSASFVPFMQLTTANRREVVEDLLDIKIFSAMNSVLKEKLKNKNDNLKQILLQSKTIEEKIEMQKSFIEELENLGNANINNNKEKIANFDSEIGDLLNANFSLEDPLRENIKQQDEMIGFAEKLRKLGNLKGKISQKIVTITEEHKFFNENTICPTCTQSIDESFRVEKLKDVQNKAKELQSGYKELEEAIREEEQRELKYNNLSKEISKITSAISHNNLTINNIRKQIKDLETEIESITQQSKNKNKEKDNLKKLETELNDSLNERAECKVDINYLEFVNQLLKDGGIKGKIIKKYLPMMNHLINKYLQMMDFYINFTLDEEFKEHIKTPIHEDFSYDSFSEGEKMRINLSILFTWREIARMKNSVNTNLLILDEVFDSSLDFMGTDYFTKIIKFVIKDTNVFVISHKTDELIDKFDRVIKFDKVKGFSKMVD